MTGSAAEVAAAISRHDAFLLTSHARPDGDAIGSQLAMAFALDALGKRVRLVNHDPVPGPYRVFPGVDRIVVAPNATPLPGPAAGNEAVILLECSDLARPDVAGLERAAIINIDHHLGNTLYGSVNWFDESAAACAEMVADVIDALGVSWTREIAAHLYLGLATDTGGFRHGLISARSFRLAARVAESGVSPAELARQIFDSFSVGRVRLTGALLGAMTLHHQERRALLYYDDDILAGCGATGDDTDGLVNLPLGAKDIVAVALVRKQGEGLYRISMRSKGAVSVRDVAMRHGGGGHVNAAACSIAGTREQVTQTIVDDVASVL